MTTYARDTDPHEPLDAVLRAATAPGYPEELTGEDQAVLAFRAAAPLPVPRRRLLARVLTVKAVIIGAVAASTGVVLAAAGGVLPLVPSRGPDPVDRPAVTTTSSVPAVSPPGGPSSPGGGPGDESAPTASPPAPPGGPPCAGCPKPGKPDQPNPGKDKGKNKGDRSDHASSPPSQPALTSQSPPTQPPTPPPPFDGIETPGSPAPGAVTAVPPTGAKPPSPGG